MPTTSLLAGSYEKFVFAYDVDVRGNGNGGGEALAASFSTAAHAASVRCCAATSRVAASGGADDVVRVFDLKARRDKGTLVHHNGSVTCLAFHGRGVDGSGAADYLVSGSADGELATWSAAEGWERLAALDKGHAQGVGVRGVCVHPTGMMALSVGDDSSVCLWNMPLGKPSYKGKLRAGYSTAPDFVRFTSDCEGYVCVAGSEVHLHAIEEGERPVASVDGGARLLCADLVGRGGEDVCLAGGEGGLLAAFDMRQRAAAVSLRGAHATRVRGVCSASGAELCEGGLPRWVASGASDGVIKLWDLRMASQDDTGAGVLAEVSTDARITCLCAGVYGSGKRGRKHSDKGGEGEGEDAGVAAGVSPQKADGDGSSVAKKKKKKKKSVAAS